MIDPHVHLRDWEQDNKETVKHGFSVAYRAGLDAVFEMPNTDPALTSRETIEKRIELADRAIQELRINIFHGLYAGITVDPEQIKEIVRAYNDLFPRVVGIKMFAGHSTGNMGIVELEDQEMVYKALAELGYEAVLAVHCEKESELRPELWDPGNPFTHTLARPPEAEVESVKDQVRFAKKYGFEGTLHVCHVSVPGSITLLYDAWINSGLSISCGVTPHHLMLYDEMMEEDDGLLFKMNPSLRPGRMVGGLWNFLINMKINWIETDHAPHTLKDKLESHASGIPVLPYLPYFIDRLRIEGIPQESIDALTHDNIVKAFGLPPGLIPNTHREPEYNLAKEYEFDPFKQVRNI